MQDPGRDLELALMRLSWRVDALDAARKVIEEDVAVAKKQLAQRSNADRIGEAVAQRMASERHRFFVSWPQRVAAVVTFVLLVSGPVARIVHGIVSLVHSH